MTKEISKQRRVRFTLLHAILLVFLSGMACGVWACYLNTHLFVPAHLTARPVGGVAGCARNLNQIAMALEAYAVDHHSYPRSQYDLLPSYLRELPRCPEANRMTYRTSFGVHPYHFLIECTGENHRSSWVAPDFPAYHSQQGLMVEQTW